MQTTLLSKLQNPHLIQPPSPFFTSNKKMSIFLPNRINFQTPNLKTHLRNPIVCARRKKKFSILGNSKSRKELFVSAYYIASKLKILPEPLDFVIREFAVGNGGGGGGGGWWNWNQGSGGFDGWGRGRKKGVNWKFWGCFVILEIMMVLGVLSFGEDLGIKEVLGVVGLSLFGVLVNGWWVNGLKDWALGFCCCGVLFVWVFKRREIEKLVKDYGGVKIVGRRRKKNGNFQGMIQNICKKLS